MDWDLSLRRKKLTTKYFHGVFDRFFGKDQTRLYFIVCNKKMSRFKAGLGWEIIMLSSGTFSKWTWDFSMRKQIDNKIFSWGLLIDFWGKDQTRLSFIVFKKK